MKLTREQRAACFKGEWPRITYPGTDPCPVEKGERYRLSSVCELVVTGIRRSRTNEWVLVYEVNRQERPLWVAERSPKANTEAEREGFSYEQEHGYTRSRSQALDPSEAVDRDELADYRHSQEAKERYQRERLEEVADLLAAMTELRAAIDNMNPKVKRSSSRVFWMLRSRLDIAERQLRQKLAA